ncbi:MAG TPA: HAMP domain-containing sensor histidine kinase [Bacteroidia bacterium]|jgi:signal transduction histidine kinase|nr:HAMP domain-containing sensor histidine kinase [Bacteroidia bacterium]
MKVKNRLSLQFTFMFAILLFVVLIGIYVLVDRNRQESFYAKLDDRALIVGELYLAQDNMSPESFKKVIEKYPQTLTHEVTRIYNDKFLPVFIKEDSVSWSKDIIQKVIQQKKIHFAIGKQQVTGLYYIDNSGNFIVIASAIDDSGFLNMKRMAFIMLFAFLASLVITFLLGRIFATLALQPILKITSDLKIVRSTSLDKRLSLSRYKNDEINQLSTTINNLLEHLEQSFLDQQAFITNASHELKTPLTKILGNAEVTLKNDRDKEDYKNVLQGIIKETEKLDSLINSLLELAQSTTDTAELQKIQLNELLWEVIDEWGGKPGQVKVNYNLPQETEKYTIQGNRRLLFIAIGNILKNAIKFSGNKEVVCEMYCDDNAVYITIKDTGIGIDNSELQAIFQPFYRASNAIRQPGSGIGLSLAEKIIRLHNGKIEVSSVLNEGTIFSVIFNT